MRFATLLLSMLLRVCRDPYRTDLTHTTKTKPKQADLVGTYVPTEATRELISSVGGYPSRATSIELDADGGVQITDIPDWWHLPARVIATGFDSGSGTWKLRESEGRWGLKLHFPSMKDFNSDRWRAKAAGRPADHPDVALSTGALLVGEEPPYAIELGIKRRGVDRLMRFTRIETPGSDR